MRGMTTIGVLFLAATAAAELPQGLVLRLSCDEFKSNGTVLPDMTGSNGSARVSGVKSAAGGRLGAACEFTGKNSYLQVTNGPALNCKRVTLCAWFKTGKAEWPDRALFDRQASGGYALTLLSGKPERHGRLRFAAGGQECLSDAGLADNAWHHAAAVYDGEKLKLYVDGQLQKRVATWKGELPTGGKELTIGMNRSNPGSNKEKEAAFEGLMDEIAVYNRGLTEEEVKRALAETKPKFTKQQVERRLSELKDLYERGLILQDFYDRKVKECEVEK